MGSSSGFWRTAGSGVGARVLIAAALSPHAFRAQRALAEAERLRELVGVAQMKKIIPVTD